MRKLLFGMLLLIPFLRSHAQGSGDTSSSGVCGSFPPYYATLATKPGTYSSALTAPPAIAAGARDTCGKIIFFYEDVHIALSGGIAYGFAHPGGVGTTRRNTMCEMANYVQSVWDFSKIPSGQYLRIYIAKSPSTGWPVPFPDNQIMRGGPYYDSTHVAGDTVNGFCWDFLTNGVDPANADTFYHGTMELNFYQYGDNSIIVSSGIAARPFDKPTLWTNDTASTTGCSFDLYTCALHSFQHALGFVQWTDFPVHIPTAPGVLSPKKYKSNVSVSVRRTPGPWGVYNPFAPGVMELVDTAAVSTASFTTWINGKACPYNYYYTYGHLGAFQSDYLGIHRISPGDIQDFVLSYPLGEDFLKRRYLKGDLETLHEVLGLDYNPTFSAVNATMLANKVPWSSKMSYSGNINFQQPVFIETVPADFTMVNNTGSSLVIHLNGDTTNRDDDGDSVSVYPGSLYNIRGCGTDGNNHNLLALSNSDRTITFTPRENFFGRAQFGFNLYDGKEKGAFVLYTIDVEKGTHTSFATGDNMLFNGSFEAGEEVKTTSNPDVNNSMCFHPDYRYGRMSNNWVDGERFSNGAVVRNSFKQCRDATAAPFGRLDYSFPWTGYTSTAGDITIIVGDTTRARQPESTTGAGNDRYQFQNGAAFYHLMDTLRACRRYRLEFDAIQPITYNSYNKVPYGFDSVTVGFTTESNLTYPGSAHLVQRYSPLRINGLDTNSWNHYSLQITYCSDTPSTLMYLNFKQYPLFYMPGIFIDNLSLKELPSTTAWTVSIQDSAMPTPCQHRLYVVPDFMGCPITYEWRNASGALVSDSSSAVIKNNVTGYYTVKVNDGCGHSALDTITLTPCSCSMGAVFGSAKDSVLPATLATGLSSGEYHLSGDLDITASLSFSNVNVLIEPGSRISVAPGVKLTLDHAHLLVCPDTNKLWKGIMLQSGGVASQISVMGNSLIEDADTAIKADYINTPASGYIVETDDAIFNRNRCGIYLGHYIAIGSTIYPFRIGRTLFATRELRTHSGYPATWPGGSILRARLTSTASTAPPFRIVRDYTGVYLKNGGYSEAGVVLDAVGLTSGTTFYAAQIGVTTDTSYRNVFDRTGDGIAAVNSNVRVINGTFLKMESLPTYLRIPGVKYPDGAGVASRNGYKRRLVVTYTSGINSDIRNEFFDCEKGILSSGYSVDSIYNNDFYQSNTNAAARLRGLDLELIRYDSIRVEGNRFYNYPVGIYALANASGAGYSFGTCHLKNNRIQAQWPSPFAAVGAHSVTQGIQVEGSVASAGGSGIGWMNVDHNVLTGVWNGIRLNNFVKQRAYIAANAINMNDQGATYLQYGVYTANTNEAVVYGNVVSGTTTMKYNDYKRGFYSAANKQLAIQCNSAKSTGRGFDFYGTQPRTYWWGNKMMDHFYGFALGGIIDQQGYSLQASLNEWNGTVPTGGAQTYTYSGANSANSVLYVDNAISNQLPTVNMGLSLTAPYVDMSTLIHTSYVTHNPCAGGPSSTRVDSIPRLSLFGKIMLKTLEFSDRDGEQSWMAQFGLWRMLHADDSFDIRNNYQFTNFATVAAGSRMAWLTRIEDTLAAGDTTAAGNLLAQPVSGLGELAVDSTLTFADGHYADSIVANYVRYYSLYRDYLRQGACDSTALAGLSYRCPHVSGDVVYQARSLYETLYGLGIHYDEDSLCAGGSTARRGIGDEHNAPGSAGAYRLFPNPNNGSFTLYCNGCDKKSVTLKVYNSTGMLVKYQGATFVAGAFNVQLSTSAPGLYLLCIDEGKGKTYCLRFVLQ